MEGWLAAGRVSDGIDNSTALRDDTLLDKLLEGRSGNISVLLSKAGSDFSCLLARESLCSTGSSIFCRIPSSSGVSAEIILDTSIGSWTCWGYGGEFARSTTSTSKSSPLVLRFAADQRFLFKEGTSLPWLDLLNEMVESVIESADGSSDSISFEACIAAWRSLSKVGDSSLANWLEVPKTKSWVPICFRADSGESSIGACAVPLPSLSTLFTGLLERDLDDFWLPLSITRSVVWYEKYWRRGAAFAGSSSSGLYADVARPVIVLAFFLATFALQASNEASPFEVDILVVTSSTSFLFLVRAPSGIFCSIFLVPESLNP